MILRLLKKLLTINTLGLTLVMIALETLVYGMSSSLHGTDTKTFFWICLPALWIALLLNRARWSGIQTSALMIAVGIVGVWILGARLALPLIALFRSLFDLLPQIVPAIRDRVAIDTTPVAASWQIILQASSALAARWHTWFAGIDKNINVNDALIRTMIWTLFLWLIAAWSGWFSARRNAILVLLPHIALLAVLISYSERKVETLWVLVFIVLVLMGVWNYKNHTSQWERRKVDYSDSILYDNTQAVMLLAATIGLLAFITPSVSWRDVRDYFRERDNSNKTAEMLGIEEKKVATKNSSGLKPSLPREHLLTEGFAQSQRIVMTIRTGELPPIPDSELDIPIPRYYWRSTTYDVYTGAGWVTSGAAPQNYRANTPLIPGLLDGYRPLHLDVELEQPEGKLFWSGLLYSADTPIRGDWRVRPVSDLFADQTALLQADMFAAASGATSYSAEAYVPVVTIEELRHASTEYPEEIRARYLTLPQSLPKRVPQLAKQITQGIDNPYDKSKAIENYLRTKYPYDLDVPVPPEDQDVADYFLFDLKKGYCDYYATAMVVLARASGLPTRFVSGYSSGAYDSFGAQYVIRELNAHSWVEVYFPEIGWIEFEPTGSQPEIVRPEKKSDVSSPVEPVTRASRFFFPFKQGKLLYWLSPLGLILLLVTLYFSLIEWVLFMSLAPSKTIEILFHRYYRMGRSLAGQRTRAETAHEFTIKLFRRLEEIHADVKSREWLNQLHADLDQFTSLYSATLFSDHVVAKSHSKNAFQVWRRLRRELLKEKIRYTVLSRNKVKRPSYESS